MSFTNARSINNKFDNIKLLLHSSKVNILAISESWLKPVHESSNFYIPNYLFFRCDRLKNRGGGVCAWISNNYSPQVCFTSNLHSEFIIIHLTSLKILLGVIYIPPDISAQEKNLLSSEITDSFDQLLIKLPNSRLILCGDFNSFPVNLLNSSMDLVNIVNTPTRGSATLDLALMDNDMANNYNVQIDSPLSSSDHNIITLIPNIQSVKKKVPSYSISWDFRASNMNSLLNNLQLVNWNLDELTAEDSVIRFHATLSSLLSNCIPRKTIVFSDNDKQWVTPRLKSLLNDKWRAWRNKNFPVFQHFKDKLKSEIVIAKKNWASRIRTNSKNTWSAVNEIRGSKKKNQSSSQSISDLFSSNTEAIIHITNLFSSKFGPPSNYECQSNNFDLSEVPAFTEQEVSMIIQKLKKKKASGKDKIPTKVYINSSDVIITPLTTIFNKCLRHKEFPNYWKEAAVIPLPKVNPPTKQDLRPVSLLCVPGKILESLILKRIKKDILKKYDSNQFGFLPMSSTTCALVAMQHYITELLDLRRVSCVIVIAVDLSAAFDLVSHDILLKKLRHLHSTYFNILKDFLKNRSQRILLCKEEGSLTHVPSGVPQGSILSPYLFGLFFADFQPHLQRSNIVKYADDGTIIFPVFKNENADAIYNLINEEISSTNTWCNNNMQKLNLSKVKILRIGQNIPWRPEDIDVYGTLFTYELKILGVTWNYKLNWNSHITTIYKTASRRLYTLRILKSVLTKEELKLLYTATIRSLMEYAAAVFDHLPNKLQSLLDRVQSRAHKIICNNNCPCFQNLLQRRHKLSFALFHKVVNNSNHTLYQFLSLRSNSGRFILPHIRTNFKLNNFIIANSIKFNSNL